MRFKLAIILILIIPNIMKSQNATATLQNALSCSGDTVLVALNVTNFIDVAAMTIYIGYDTTQAEFLSLQNINPAVTGYLSANAANGQVGIAYSSVNSFNITSGKLFDLRFSFFGDSTLLPFNAGTEIANSNLEVIPLDTYPGSISNGMSIIDQPDSVQAYPDNDVMFSVTATGNVTYLWQENTGNGWNNLQNNSTYSGVDNDTLNIYDVPLSYDGYTYRCILSAGNCGDTSQTALLEVALAYPSAMLGTMVLCPEAQVLEPLYVGDLFDMVEFTFNISFDPFNLDFQGIENINPLIFTGNIITTPLTSPPGISIHWEDVTPVSVTSGKLFDLNFYYHAQNNDLAFEDGTQAINAQSNPINLTLTNGQINQYELPVITVQPQSTTVTEGDDALFKVTANGVTGYQWQLSMDEGTTWTDLTNTPPYYNVTTQQMTISPVSLPMDGNMYICILENDHCDVNTAPALLTVDSLNLSREVKNENVLITLQPNPFHDIVNITLDYYYSDVNINIYGTKGDLLVSLMEKGHYGRLITIDLSDHADGLFFVEMTGRYQDKPFIETRKIIKSN